LREPTISSSALTGNVADISMALPLLTAVAPAKRLIADEAYDVESLRGWLKGRRVKAVIPCTASRTVPYPFDRAAYQRRNQIERLFGRSRTGDASRPGMTGSLETVPSWRNTIRDIVIAVLSSLCWRSVRTDRLCSQNFFQLHFSA